MKEPEDHFHEKEAQAGAHAHYVRDGIEWLMSNGCMEELCEILKWANGEVAKRNRKVLVDENN